jgi:hypothetical protein
MQDLLRYANYAKVGEELKVTRQTVARWAKGESVPQWATQAIERLMLGESKEAAPPEWARRLHAELLDEVRRNREETERVLRAMADDLAARLLEGGEPGRDAGAH